MRFTVEPSKCKAFFRIWDAQRKMEVGTCAQGSQAEKIVIALNLIEEKRCGKKKKIKTGYTKGKNQRIPTENLFKLTRAAGSLSPAR